MSLTVDGVWKAGLWAPTVWADGVWREGAPAAPQSSNPYGGGRTYAYPEAPKKKKPKVIRQPLPEYEVSGPLARQTRIENTTLPEWDVEAWEASLKTLAHLEREDRAKRVRKAETALILWLL